jgi:hypothetical protein
LANTFKLIRRDNPKPDESLVSYILRLTIMNGYATPAWIMRSIGLDGDQLCHGFTFLFKPPSDLKLLSEATGVSISTLASLKYAPTGMFGAIPLFSFFGSSLPRSVIRPVRPKVCPRCLRQAGYYRRIWDSVFVTACPEHECLLIDECPNCGWKFSWTLSDLSGICRCDYDWCKRSSRSAEESGLILSRHIHRLCNLPLTGSNEGYDKGQNPALALGLQDFIWAMIFIANQPMGVPGALAVPYTMGKGCMGNAEIHPLFSKAFFVFQNWPESFYKFLDQGRVQGSNFMTQSQKQKNGFPLDLDKFRTGLYKHLPSGQFDFMRIALHTYLMDRGRRSHSPVKREEKVVKRHRKLHKLGAYRAQTYERL